MQARITVREFARLTTDNVVASLDQATVSASAFDWLCQESARLRTSGASLVQVGSRSWLRLDNYVGVIQTPCGTQIEILPKHVNRADEATAASARLLLRKMLTRCLNVTPRQSSPADIQAFDAPLSEWVMRHFLEGLEHLIKRGVRFDYRPVKEEQRFLRGRLDVARQLRQPPGRAHLFQIEHDIFDADRPENRLLKNALDRVCKLTQDSGNWRLSRELTVYFADVPRSRNVSSDFRAWKDDRLMAHYRPIRPWCTLILNEQDPTAILGSWHGVSLLFPMERLFERYVEICLRRQLPDGVSLKATASSEHLCRHETQHWFRMRPDFLLCHGDARWVMDTKWKRLDATLSNGTEKYGLGQDDFYQMFAYGHRYLPGMGPMMLIYPMTECFKEALPVFDYSNGLLLWVVPFDLENDRVVVDAPFIEDANWPFAPNWIARTRSALPLQECLKGG